MKLVEKEIKKKKRRTKKLYSIEMKRLLIQKRKKNVKVANYCTLFKIRLSQLRKSHSLTSATFLTSYIAYRCNMFSKNQLCLACRRISYHLHHMAYL